MYDQAAARVRLRPVTLQGRHRPAEVARQGLQHRTRDGIGSGYKLAEFRLNFGLPRETSGPKVCAAMALKPNHMGPAKIRRAVSSVVEHFPDTPSAAPEECVSNTRFSGDRKPLKGCASNVAPNKLSNSPRFVRLDTTLWRSTGTGELWFIGRVDGRVRWKPLGTADRRIGRIRAAMNATDGMNGNHAVFLVEDGRYHLIPAGPAEDPPARLLPCIREKPLAELLAEQKPAQAPSRADAEPPAATGMPTLRELVRRWRLAQEGRAPATLEKHDFTISTLDRYLDLDRPVSEYRPQDVREAAAKARSRGLKGQTINETVLRLLRNAFHLAVEDHLIASNPVTSVKGERRDPIVRKQLAWEDANRVLEDIKSRSLESYLQLKFILLLGVGKAEAKGLTGGAVNWTTSKIAFVRKKTGEPFEVPIYPWAKEFIRQLEPRFQPGVPVFDWRNPRRALITACEHCGVAPMTPLSLRRTLIVHLLEQGAEPRLVAQWQGHRDATLIHRTYGKHINSAHERAQIARLHAGHVPESSQPHPGPAPPGGHQEGQDSGR